MVSAPLAGKFQDHYQVLGIGPSSDSDAIRDAYTKLSAKYNLGNPATADREKFEAVALAYEVLSDPTARRVFDEVRSGPAKEPESQFAADEFFRMLEVETMRRKAILCLLYDRRRQNPIRPALSLRQVESLIASTSDEIQFSMWYLKQKGYAASDDKSNTQITVPGIDFLDQNPPSREEVMRLLKAPIKAPAIPDLAALASAVEQSAAPSPQVPPTPATPEVGQTAPAHSAAVVTQTLKLPKRTIVIPPRSNGQVP
jgi:curved DNA-binding protein CbpA